MSKRVRKFKPSREYPLLSIYATICRIAGAMGLIGSLIMFIASFGSDNISFVQSVFFALSSVAVAALGEALKAFANIAHDSEEAAWYAKQQYERDELKDYGDVPPVPQRRRRRRDGVTRVRA